MRKIFIVLCVLLISLAFLVFHDKGNAYLKPYFANYLQGKLAVASSVELRHLKIDLNYVEMEILLNGRIHLDTKGELSLFTGALAIDYTVKSDDLQNKIDINGMITGAMYDMDIQGVGDLFKTKVNYALNVQDNLIKKMKIKMNDADVASLLAFTEHPAYARGKVDVNIDIENFEKQSMRSAPQIVLHETILNEQVFKEALQIEIPSETTLTAKLNVKIANQSFQLKGLVHSNLAILELSKTYYNRKTKELSSGYTLLIPQLSKVMSNHKHKLNGKLKVVGTFQRKNAEVYLSGKSEDLGGRMVFDLKGNKLNAHMNDVDIEKLLLLFGEKPYLSGKIMSDIVLDDFKKQEGTFTFQTKEAKSIDVALSKASNLHFGEDVCFSLNAKGDISPKVINMKAKFESDIATYDSSNIKYHRSSKMLSSTYLLHIAKLSKLNSLTGKRLKGELSINGELKYQNEIFLTGKTENLGGSIGFQLQSEKLHATIDKVSVEKLMTVLDYPQVFKAKLVGDFNYDLATSSGKLTSKLNEAELLSPYLLQVIKGIKGVDLRDKHYAQTYFNATFRKNLVDINFKAQGEQILLSIPSGQINKVHNNINACYKVKIDNKTLEGRIRGDVSSPKITFDSSKYIQNNMLSVIEESMNPSKITDFGMGGFFK